MKSYSFLFVIENLQIKKQPIRSACKIWGLVFLFLVINKYRNANGILIKLN